MKNILLFCCGIVFFLNSCVSAKGELKEEIEALMNAEIALPTDLEPTLMGKKIPNMDLMNTPLKLVVWYDSTGCSPCRIQQMYKWYEIIDYAKESEQKFRVIFIFTPRQGEDIAKSLISFNYPVYIDKKTDFIINNHRLPQKETFKTFLLDQNNKIVMVGNPIGNEKLWELYKERINILSN